MDSVQFEKLIVSLTRVADGMRQPYTLTGASDWPMLVLFGGVLIAVVGFMWRDLRATIKDSADGHRVALDREAVEREKQDNLLWAEIRAVRGEMKDCREDCQP